jgi:hypothetical protein
LQAGLSGELADHVDTAVADHVLDVEGWHGCEGTEPESI